MLHALPPLVITWVGSYFPACDHTSPKLAKLLSGLPVILVSSKEIGIVSDVDSQYFIEDFYIAPSSWNNSFRADIHFREGLWIKTTERFFINLISEAAAVGQFLFGIDNGNATTFLFNGFKNENAAYVFWYLNYYLDFEKNFFVTNLRIIQIFNLFNMHVQSKLYLRRFITRIGVIKY